MTRGSTKFKKGQPRNDTTFKPGQSGNPGGRPVNARSRKGPPRAFGWG